MNDNSRFQRFLWTVAGAEISILEQKECRTDHKKFAAIGATILMTTIIAFFAGTSAAWFFTQSGDDKSGNILGSMAFGVLWATLIFTIDRSLVITLKKNPELKKQKWVVPFFSRAALAVLIAFMVSIPLELTIFGGLIKEQKTFWEQENKDELTSITDSHKKSESIGKDQEQNSRSQTNYETQKSGLEKQKEEKEKRVRTLRAELDHPNTSRYNQAVRDYTDANANINTLSKQKDEAARANNRSRENELQQRINNLYTKRNSASSIKSEEVSKWNKPRNEEIAKLNNEISALVAQIEEKQSTINDLVAQNIKLQERKSKYDEETDKTLETHDKDSEGANHFIQNFRILEYAVKKPNHEMDFFFLWMIRMLFFIVEILPTVVKIVMPVGSYDRMVHAEEKSIEQYIESDDYKEKLKQLHLSELEARNKLVEQQQEIEAELKAEILKQVKEAQLEIATLAVNKWREREKAKQEKLYSQPDTQNDDEDVDEEEMTYSAV